MKPRCSFCGEEFSDEDNYPRTKCDCTLLWRRWLTRSGSEQSKEYEDWIEAKLFDENGKPKFSGGWF